MTTPSTNSSGTANIKRMDGNALVDTAADGAEYAIKSTQRVANDALNSLSDTVQDARKQASPVINRAAEQAAALAQKSLDAVRESSQAVREKIVTAQDYTSTYIRDEPLKAMLIAAATGAALMAMLSLLNRSR